MISFGGLVAISSRSLATIAFVSHLIDYEN
ncbi:hypothetical protein AGR13a_Lc140046 [Agrobacterium genomosp. 13 str. CFBP 6927]|uniref:Uncharacterized protein n=1 Tax=Agrobacterium genomosp. 13 str. CFBP 6927 TaxID=1183428 RepID=A0ABP2BQ79_9HYPH|nr:hypothetical protein AGR13a_Lc140046 [Agrobacterium genomosp. 13 str. CFBP 6927]